MDQDEEGAHGNLEAEDASREADWRVGRDALEDHEASAGNQEENGEGCDSGRGHHA
jgi:hypothetical protein